MDINNEYLRVSKEVRESFISNPDRVRILGAVKLKEFEKAFPEEIVATELSAAKAVHIALQRPSAPLSSLQSILTRHLPSIG